MTSSTQFSYSNVPVVASSNSNVGIPLLRDGISSAVISLAAQVEYRRFTCVRSSTAPCGMWYMELGLNCCIAISSISLDMYITFSQSGSSPTATASVTFPMAGTTLVQSGHHFAANNNPIILGDEVPKSMDGNISEKEECTVDLDGWESLVSNLKLTCFVCRDDRAFLVLDRIASL